VGLKISCKIFQKNLRFSHLSRYPYLKAMFSISQSNDLHLLKQGISLPSLFFDLYFLGYFILSVFLGFFFLLLVFFFFFCSSFSLSFSSFLLNFFFVSFFSEFFFFFLFFFFFYLSQFLFSFSRGYSFQLGDSLVDYWCVLIFMLLSLQFVRACGFLLSFCDYK
jgi:hypothetical protein